MYGAKLFDKATGGISDAQETQLNTATSNITSHATLINDLQSSQVTQNTSITGINTTIATNASNISTNTSAISLNTAKTGISTDQATKLGHIDVGSAINLDNTTGNITTNATQIAALLIDTTNKFAMTSTTAMKGQVESNQVDIVTATNAIASNVSNISTNNAEIVANTGLIATKSAWQGNVDQAPRNSFFYGRRPKLLGSASTPNIWDIPATQTAITWSGTKCIFNGSLSFDSATGYLTTSSTGLFKVQAKICVNTTTAQRVAKILIKTSGGVEVIVGKHHLSRHESDNNTFSAPTIMGIVRLQTGINYLFYVECDNDGDGNVVNYMYDNNDVMVEGLCLPNGYTLATDYSPV